MVRHVAENRKSYRFPFRTKFIFASDKGVFAGNALNLSKQGIFIAAFNSHQFQRGTVCNCLFQIYPDEAPIKIQATVQRIVVIGPNPDEIPGIGFSFSSEDLQSQEKLQLFAETSRKNFEASYTILNAGEPDRASLDPLIDQLHLPPFLDLGELRFHVERILKGLEGLDAAMASP